MLLQLSIRNFALIDQITIEFKNGLNVLTGETGAGKSILIDALRLVLGERMEMSQIRDKNESCFLEAVFAVEDKDLRKVACLSAFLAEEDECLILKREITPEGRSKNYINQQFVNLSQLKEVGAYLVDIHGQYDHQQIFDPGSHLKLIDAFAGLRLNVTGNEGATALKSYQESYVRYAYLLEQKKKLQDQCEGKEREIDLLTYQIQEIEKVDPQDGEEQGLKEERIHLVYAEKLHLITSRVLSALSEEEMSASSRLSSIYRDLLEWIKIDPPVEAVKNEIDSIQLQLEEAIQKISQYQEKLSFDSKRLEEIDQRLEQLEWLGKKYGKDTTALRTFLDEAKGKLDQLVNAENYQKDFDKEIEQLLPELQKKAGVLSRARKKAAEDLAGTVLNDLKDLGIRNAKFECRLSKIDYGPQGQENAEFLLNPNPGESLKPLADIASGGEASRIMLAIKHTLARADHIPTLIFDEIDANVGGRLGQCVGQKLKEITKCHQVLLITHLPQIASFADHHLRVQKWVQKGKTRVEYEVLEGDKRIQELAQMMSGDNETKISKAHAEEMLKTATQ